MIVSLRRAAVILFLLFACSAPASAAPVPFVPDRPTISVGAVRPGMGGYLLTVLRGTKPVRLPLTVVDVVPQKGEVRSAILVRLLPSPYNRSGGVAQGMSGSPVYIGGRLAGAVGSGWEFSDHNLAMVTPIEDMCAVFSRPERLARPRGLSGRGTNAPAAPLSVAGLGGGGADRLSRSLGVSVSPTPVGSSEELRVVPGRLSPGEAVAALLVWGDVEVGATGTVTATSRDGRFLAFGHPFLGRGAVNFPVARARIHETVYSQAFPFKLGSPVSLVGTVTQDRAAGIGGRTDFFTPSVSATLAFTDLDQGGERTVRNVRVVPDPFLGSRLLEGVFTGLLDEVWRRKGQGTMTVNLRIDGRGVENGWTRTNVFFSETDVSSAALREAARIWELFLLQPFADGMPVGFRLEVEATEEPRVLFIEDVAVSSDARPGDSLEVGVTLRPWRRRPVRKEFRLTVPKEATGTCELLVRGGGIQPLPQLALDGGWKSIDGLKRLLTEVGAMDANNELVVELLCDPDTIKAAKEGVRSDDRRDSPELLPEEREFLSETKARRIGEGTLRISRSDYVVDGLMKRLITVREEEE
ncbi:MAG: SpoIVB peptidase S55 domain-containing protein [Fretibacterium sp.]|nr:SpoIVB peptidase S55 domain-containing protein [Fretibacterium sp.]